MKLNQGILLHVLYIGRSVDYYMLSNYQEKAALIREKMRHEGLDAYIVLALDPHKSIAVADHWKTVQWLTGFSGWVCTLVLTDKDAGFWTDGRYVTQAARELPKDIIERHCISDPTDESYANWLMRRLPEGASVGLNGGIASKADIDRLSCQLARKRIRVLPRYDFISDIWHERPDIPSNPLFELGITYSGISRTDKLALIRDIMEKEGANYYLLSALDNIAWLTNLRGADSALYPIFHAYMLVSMDEAVLFTKINKLSPMLIKNLDQDGIMVRDFDEITTYLKGLSQAGALYYDPNYTAYSLVNALPQEIFKIEALDIVTKVKAIKNPVEQNNLKNANIQEAVCVTRLIKYIKDNIGRIPLDEYQIGQWINQERIKWSEFLQPANVPIVGCADHAVQLHYRPTRDRSAQLPQAGFLLFDLCAHYLNGSTDITRTIALGEITESMRRDYTLVLKSQIKLATQKFLYGVTGPELDAIAKSLIWNERLNNPAGTGHGMGYCLYIQEGPCKIAIDPSPYFYAMMSTPIEPGMLFSNEPGIYKKGLYAIRLENSILAREDVINEFGRFLSFETVTFIPYELNCIDFSMMTAEEKQWLDDYNKTVYATISPYLNDDEAQWLRSITIDFM